MPWLLALHCPFSGLTPHVLHVKLDNAAWCHTYTTSSKSVQMLSVFHVAPAGEMCKSWFHNTLSISRSWPFYPEFSARNFVLLIDAHKVMECRTEAR